MNDEYLADIQTDEPLPQIKIDGKGYALKLNMEYVDLKRHVQTGKQIQDLAGKEEPLTEQEEAKLSAKMRELTAAVVDAPAEVLAKLRDIPHRLAISRVFTAQVEERLRPFVQAGGEASPASSDSTAAVPTTGSTSTPE